MSREASDADGPAPATAPGPSQAPADALPGDPPADALPGDPPADALPGDPPAAARQARSRAWFAAFEARTTEKPASLAALDATVAALDAAGLLPRRDLRFLDLGCGPGGLLGPMIARLSAAGRRIDAYGLDSDPHHVAQAAVAAGGRARAVVGDAFAPAPAIRAALGLEAGAGIDLVLAAHVGYFAPDLDRWDETLQDLTGASGVAVIIQEAVFAPFSARLNPLSGTRTTARLRQVLAERRRPNATLGFRAGVRLPPLTPRLIDALAAAPPLPDGDPHGDPHGDLADGLTARLLAEFLIQRPLETVAPADRRRYLEELRALASVNQGLVPMDNALIVVLPARGGDAAQDRARVAALQRAIRAALG